MGIIGDILDFKFSVTEVGMSKTIQIIQKLWMLFMDHRWREPGMGLWHTWIKEKPPLAGHISSSLQTGPSWLTSQHHGMQTDIVSLYALLHDIESSRFIKKVDFQSRKPPGYPKWMILLMPFDTAMWVATSSMCALVSLFLVIYTSRCTAVQGSISGALVLNSSLLV